MAKQGLIFDIQGFSVHDGPGDRTLIFMNGCPLRCEWCANPEGMKKGHNLMYTNARCKAKQNGCSRCITACPYGAISIGTDSGLPVIKRKYCDDCAGHECVNACNYEAMRLSGRYYTLQELMKVINRDRNFWRSEGGVTFSGGEPLVQWEFVLEVLQECRKQQIHTAIETSGYADQAVFLKVMSYIDFAFIDIKHMDSKAYVSKTGVGNERILNNLRALAQSGWQGRLILRTAIIPGFNDSVENAQATAKFMKENGFFEINLLPFHRLGTSKWDQLGETYPYRDQESLHKEDLIPLQDIFLDEHIVCYLENDIAYNLKPLNPTSAI